MALPTRELRHPHLRYTDPAFSVNEVHVFESRLRPIYEREIHRVRVLDFEGLPERIRDDLSLRTQMTWQGEADEGDFFSHAWSRLFSVQGPLVREFILEFPSTCTISASMGLDVLAMTFQLGGARRDLTWRQFILAMGLHTAEEMEQPSFEHYWVHSLREVPDKGALAGYWTQISSGLDFTATAAPTYRLIRDPRLRMIHRLLAYTICGRA